MAVAQESPLWQRVPDESGWWGADKVKSVLHGRIADLPPQRSRTVRIFLSSTFTDTTVERNQLMQTTYPKLKKYCKERHGLDFQVVDMRWGIRHNARDDHSASDLCMREIKLCQQVSIGPAFVTLLGQRYGSRPLQARINAQEFENIRQCLRMANVDVSVIDEWYKRDDNAVPPNYILQPIIDIDNSEWALIEKSIGELISQGVTLCISRGLMTESDAQRFSRSVTHEEVDRGILQSANPNAHCLCFSREIRNINLQHKKAWRFIDIDEDGNIEESAQRTLTDLKEQSVPSALSKNNIHHFEIDWSDNEGINTTDHADYLNRFCHIFENEIKRLVDQSMDKAETGHLDDDLFAEVLGHAHQSFQRCSKFHGREDILSRVRAYIHGDSNQPFVVHGNSGLGKTSIMAVSAKLIPEWIGENPDTVIVLRFLGTTPKTSTMHLTLSSVCQQLVQVYNLREKYQILAKDYKELVEQFQNILRDIPPKKRLVLILDSLDQLPLNSQRSTWIPQTLPENVKLIVSILTDEFEKTFSALNIGDDQKVVVQKLDMKTAMEIIKNWLSINRRYLSGVQFDDLKSHLNKVVTISPLYIKLVFDRLLGLPSYSSQQEILNLPKSFVSMITDLFERLENKHGRLLISRSFGYISASQKGVSDSELEDILSIDDDVLGEVYQFHTPPLRRLPSVLWSRIKNDISEYIVEREANDVTVLAWYHRQFIEQSQDRYFTKKRDEEKKNNEKIKPILQNLYEYFSGKWAGDIEKPFVYTENQKLKLGKTDDVDTAARYVSAQPLIFELSPTGEHRYNKRKLAELPMVTLQLYRRSMISRDEMVNLLYLDIEFLIALLTEVSFGIVMDYFHVYCGDKEQTELSEISLILVSMVMIGTGLHECPRMLPQNISGRVLCYYSALPDITRFINAADTIGRKYCAFVPPHMHLDTPGTDLMFTMDGHEGPVTDICMTEDHTSTMASVSRKLVFFNGANNADSLIVSVQPKNMPAGDTFMCVSGVGDLMIATLREHPYIYVASKVLNGEFLHFLNCFDNLSESSFNICGLHCSAYNETTLCFVWDTNFPYVLVYDVQDGQFECKIDCESNIVIVAASAERLVVVTSDNSVVGYDIGQLMDGEAVVQETDTLCDNSNEITATFKTNNGLCAVGFESGDVYVCDIASPKIKLDSTGNGAVHHIYMNFTKDSIRGHLVVCTAEFVDIYHVAKSYTYSNEPFSKLYAIKTKCTGALITCAGRALVLYHEGRLEAYAIDKNRNHPKQILTIYAHGRRINGVVGMPEDNIIITASADGSVKMYEIQLSGKLRRKIPPLTRSSGIITGILTHGHEAVTWSTQSCTVDVWDMETGRCTFSYNNPCDSLPFTAAVMYGSANLCTLDAGGNVLFWQGFLASSEQIMKGKLLLVLREVVDYTNGLQFLLTSPDSDHVLIVSDIGNVVVIDTSNKEIVNSFKCVVNANRARMQHANVVRGGVLVIPHATNIHCYAYLTGKRLTTQYDQGSHSPELACFCFPNSDRIVISGSKQVSWNPKTGKSNKIHDLNIADSVSCCTSIDSFAIYNNDIVAFIDMTSLKLLCTYPLESAADHAAMSPDGLYFVYVVNKTKNLKLLRVSDGAHIGSYVMATEAHCLAISRDSWFVIMGTDDKRLFMLLLADPDSETHSENIKHVRKNTVFNESEAKELMDGIQGFDEDEDDADDDEELDPAIGNPNKHAEGDKYAEVEIVYLKKDYNSSARPNVKLKTIGKISTSRLCEIM